MKMWALFAASAALAAPARADMTATYTMPGAGVPMTMTIQIASNGDLRGDMTMTGVNKPMMIIRHQGRVYFVIPEPDGPLVADVEEMAAAAEEEMRKADPHFCEQIAKAPPLAALVSQGQVTIAGRTGDAYSSGGRSPGSPDVVISRDPALAPLGAAMAAQFRSSTKMMGSCAPGATVFAQMQALLDKGAPLKFGPMTLEKVEEGRVDPSRFVLPAAPATHEQIRTLMQGKKGQPITVLPAQPPKARPPAP